MTFRVLVLTTALVLVSCGPVTVYHRPGVPVQQAQQDQLTCEVAALQDAPVATEIRQGPPEFIPTHRYCDSNGHCRTRGGFWVPGEVYSVDRNKNLRNRLETQCMANNGYQRASLKRCSQSVVVDLDTASTQKLPPITESTCVSRDEDGNWLIISADAP